MDVMGGVKLADGSEAKGVTGVDDHSRFCVSALVVKQPRLCRMCDALALAMRRYGVPDQILTARRPDLHGLLRAASRSLACVQRKAR